MAGLEHQESAEISANDTAEEEGVGTIDSSTDEPITSAADSPVDGANTIHTGTAYRELQQQLYQLDPQQHNVTSRITTKLHGYVHKFCPQPIYNALKPPQNKKEWKSFWLVHVPILHWLYYYVPKYIIGDIVAGLTIGVTHIPQGTCMCVGHIVRIATHLLSFLLKPVKNY